MVPEILRRLLPIIWAHRTFASLSRLTFGGTSDAISPSEHVPTPHLVRARLSLEKAHGDHARTSL
jgi:hypothetical protein